MTPEQIAKERGEFEAWAKIIGLWLTQYDRSDTYIHGDTWGAWKGWLARAERAHARETELQGTIDAQDERERKAGEKCGVPYAESGCDWPDNVAEKVLALQAENERLRERVKELDEIKAAWGMANREV